MVLRLGCGVAEERFEAGLSRVSGPALSPWSAGDVFGRSGCAWKLLLVGLCKLVVFSLRL